MARPCSITGEMLLTDAETGRIAVYYGSADTYVGLAFTSVDEIVNYTIENDCKCDGDKTGT